MKNYQDYISRNLIGAAKLRGVVYHLKRTESNRAHVNAVNTYDLWHHRLGHLLSFLSNDLNVFGSLNKEGTNACDICYRAKRTRCPFYNSENKANDIFDMIHCDIRGSYKMSSFCGAHYFLTILDDVSKAIWVYLLKEKGEAGNLLKNFVAFVHNQFGI